MITTMKIILQVKKISGRSGGIRWDRLTIVIIKNKQEKFLWTMDPEGESQLNVGCL
jgi:hypothetical protein